MKLSTNNFLTVVKQLVTGGGYMSNGETAHNDAGFFVDKSVGHTVTLAATDVTPVEHSFVVPLDYDQATPSLSLIVNSNAGGASDTPTITATVVRRRAGVANVTLVNAVVVGSVDSQTLAVDVVDLSDAALLPGDVIDAAFTVGAHATDAVTIHSSVARYRSTLVAYDKASR